MRPRSILLGAASLALVFVVTVKRATAGEVNFTITGTYASNASSIAGISGPSDAFTMTFSLPTNPSPVSSTSNRFDVVAPLAFSFGGSTTHEIAEVGFFTSADAGLVLVRFSSGGNTYSWFLEGAQIFSGFTMSPTLLTGFFPFNQFDTSSVFQDGSVLTGTVNATATPEPPSLLLLGSGLLGLGPFLGCLRAHVS